MQFGKECNYFRVICLFFWQFIPNKRSSYSQDRIILFFLSFYLCILFHAMFFVSYFFYPNKILLIADVLQILKFWKQKLTAFWNSSLGAFELCNFFYQNILRVSNLDLSFLDPDRGQPGKYQLVVTTQNCVQSVCSTMRTLSNSFQRNRHFVGKRNNKQDRFEEKVSW